MQKLGDNFIAQQDSHELRVVYPWTISRDFTFMLVLCCTSEVPPVASIVHIPLFMWFLILSHDAFFSNNVITWMLFSFVDAVNAVEIEPEQAQYHAGDKVRCTANGNPPPKVMWKPAVKGAETGEGYSVMTVPAPTEEDPKEVTYTCSASSHIGGNVEIVDKSIIFSILGKLGATVPNLTGDKVLSCMALQDISLRPATFFGLKSIFLT